MKPEFQELPKSVRHGGSQLQTDRYSEEAISEMNHEHDSKYGFSFDCQTVYTNVHRLPESFFGDVRDLWKQPNP